MSYLLELCNHNNILNLNEIIQGTARFFKMQKKSII